MNFFFIIGCVAFTVIGQLLLKQGAMELKGADSLWDYLFNIYIFCGISSGGLAAVSWIKAMQHYDLSYAYPFTGLTFISVIILSGLVFGETIKLNQWIGLLVVIAGLYIGSR